MSLERVLILVVIGTFIVSPLTLVTSSAAPLTKERAMDVSKKAELVRHGIATSRFSQISETTYHNSTWVELMKKGLNREMYLKVLENHGIWQIVWTFMEFPVSGYTVIVIVDAEIGRITHETVGIGFR